MNKSTLFMLAVWMSRCGGETEYEVGQTVTSSPLLAALSTNDCSERQARMALEGARRGRITAVSAAYAECVDRGLRSHYLECYGDPFYGELRERQIASAINMTRSPNAVAVTCRNYSSPTIFGGADFGASYEVAGPEALRLNTAWLDAAPESAATYAEIANTIWHEVAHQHGYRHGDNFSSADAAIACRVTNPWFDFQRDTVPYIVGNCVSEVLTRSQTACSMDSCGTNALRLVSGVDSTSCVCVTDPLVDASAIPPPLTVPPEVPPEIFEHTVSASNRDPRQPHVSFLSTPGTMAAPWRVVLVSRIWRGVYNPNPLGVYYDQVRGQWAIYNDNLAPLPIGASFAVYTRNPGPGSVIVAPHNVNSTTLFDNTQTMVTHVFNPVGSTPSYFAANLSLPRRPCTRSAFDLPSSFDTCPRVDPALGANVPAHTAFNAHAAAQWFEHRSDATNTTWHMTTIDHPLANAKPKAILFVHRMIDAQDAPLSFDHPLGLWFDTSRARWVIYSEDFAPIPADVRFVVSAP